MPRSMSEKYFIVGLLLLALVVVIMVIYSKRSYDKRADYSLLGGRLTNVGALLLLFGLLLFFAGLLLSYGAH